MQNEYLRKLMRAMIQKEIKKNTVIYYLPIKLTARTMMGQIIFVPPIE